MLDGTSDPLAAARALLAQREPFYRRAHLRVETEGKRPEQIADEIASALGKETDKS